MSEEENDVRKPRPIRMSDAEWAEAEEGAELVGLSNRSEYVRWALKTTTERLKQRRNRGTDEAGAGAVEDRT